MCWLELTIIVVSPMELNCSDFLTTLTIKILSAVVLFNFINLTQVHNFTVSAQDMFTFRRLSVFTVSFTGISQVLMR